MKLIVTTEAHFQKNANGEIFSDTGCSGYSFWQRYLDVFESVEVVARVSPIKGQVSSKVEGPGVTVFSLPGYVGPAQYLSNLPKLRKRIKRICLSKTAFLLRVPSAIGNLVSNDLNSKLKIYGLEVVGDPFDVFAQGANANPLRPIFKWWFPWQLRKQCAKACAISYVTREALQQRYPAISGVFNTYYSSIQLKKEAIIKELRQWNSIKEFTIIFVGGLGHLYKAPDVLIKAVVLCINDGLDLELVIVGDGKHRNELQEQVNKKGLKEKIHFLGQLPSGQAVYNQLDKADLFVLPSRQEGLPRAMIEAMARALPCIGTTVGGIPELLNAEDMVPPGNPVALANKIKEVVTDKERMIKMSKINLERSKQYTENILQKRRILFYQYLKKKTEEENSLKNRRW